MRSFYFLPAREEERDIKETWEQLNLKMLRSGNRETKMAVGDEKEQRFYFLPCREEEEEEERASGAHNSRCKPAAGERQCPISASGFSPVCFFKYAFLDLLEFLDLNLFALCALVQFLSSVNGEACRERGASGVHKSLCSASAGLDGAPVAFLQCRPA